MFATASGYAATGRQAAAYRQMGVATGVNGASPHGLIGMLFDGLIGAIAEARGAMRAKNIPAKGRAIGRAVRIVDEGLSAALDLDQGGALASDLRGLYSYVALRLTQANLKNDEAALDECVRLIEPLQSAWSEIATLANAA